MMEAIHLMACYADETTSSLSTSHGLSLRAIAVHVDNSQIEKLTTRINSKAAFPGMNETERGPRSHIAKHDRLLTHLGTEIQGLGLCQGSE